MRLQQYINERRSKDVNSVNAMKTIASKCGKAYLAATTKRSVIYRGVTGKHPTMEIDPKKGKERRSANTLNFYTLWMDNYGTFKDYPKRGQSIICSTDYMKAVSYGKNQYIVLPQDGSKIGVVKSEDIFSLGDYTPMDNDLGQISWGIYYLIKGYFDYAREVELGGYNMEVSPPFDVDWNRMNMVNSVIHEINSLVVDDSLYDYLANVVTTPMLNFWFDDAEGDLMLFYKLVMDKKRFGLLKAGDNLQQFQYNEVWTDGYCMLVDINLWEDDQFHRNLAGYIK